MQLVCDSSGRQRPGSIDAATARRDRPVPPDVAAAAATTIVAWSREPYRQAFGRARTRTYRPAGGMDSADVGGREGLLPDSARSSC